MTLPEAASARERDRDRERRLLAALPRLRRLLARLAGRDAEDLVQETLARAWRYRDAVQDGRPLDGWLARTALRVYLDDRERRRRAPDGGGRAGVDAEQVAAAAGLDQDAWLDVRERLAGLPAVEREVLLRFHRDGQELAAIARDLGLALNTVKSHLHRARRRLAAALRPEGGT